MSVAEKFVDFEELRSKQVDMFIRTDRERECFVGTAYFWGSHSHGVLIWYLIASLVSPPKMRV